MGLSAFFDTSFAPHTDATKVAAEKPSYLDQWGQPGAMTAMLNWYRASAIDVPETGAAADRPAFLDAPFPPVTQPTLVRSEEHTSELQSLMRISYAVFCLKKKNVQSSRHMTTSVNTIQTAQHSSN